MRGDCEGLLVMKFAYNKGNINCSLINFVRLTAALCLAVTSSARGSKASSKPAQQSRPATASCTASKVR